MIRKSFFAFFIFLFPSLIFGQNFRHPYSFYGIGELQNHNFIKCQSLGGLGYAWNDSLTFSNTNPASYSNIGYTIFDIGLKGKVQNLKQGETNEWTNYFSLSNAAFGFPISRKHNWGVSFGLLPISRTGYRVFSAYEIDSIGVIESFDMQGGFNKLYIGSAVSITKKLSVGFNIAYVFGYNIRAHNLEFVKQPSYINLTKIVSQDFRGVGVDLGFQYKNSINKDVQYTIGSAFSLPINLSNNRENITYTYRSSGSLSVTKDTLELFKGTKVNLTIPMNIGAGAIFHKKNKWKAGFDFKYEKWSDFVPEIQDYKVVDQWSIALGGEIIPKIDDLAYFQRIAYRGGVRYTSTFLDVNGENLNKFSAIIGFGFPMSRNLSRINYAFEYGKVGKSSSINIKENYFSFYLGFQLNDIWFIKPKYY